jgi:tetrahydromethanopterin S-methyltransferase subunit G
MRRCTVRRWQRGTPVLEDRDIAILLGIVAAILLLAVLR